MVGLARREMLQAAQWYERKLPGLGDQLLVEIKVALTAIVQFPIAFPIIDPLFRRKILDVFPYALIYRVELETIVVIAVTGLKRHPRYWWRRIKPTGANF